MLPTFVYTLDPDGGIRVNLYTQSELRLPERGLHLVQETAYPYGETVTLRLRLDKPAAFALRLRVPQWCQGARVTVNSETTQTVPHGYHELHRTWRNGDTVRIELPMPLRVVLGTHTNEGKLALMRGPLVLAVDERFLPADAHPLEAITVPTEDAAQLPLPVVPLGDTGALWGNEVAFDTEGIVKGMQQRFILRLTDFAHAGANGTTFAVWLPRP